MQEQGLSVQSREWTAGNPVCPVNCSHRLQGRPAEMPLRTSANGRPLGMDCSDLSNPFYTHVGYNQLFVPLGSPSLKDLHCIWWLRMPTALILSVSEK